LLSFSNEGADRHSIGAEFFGKAIIKTVDGGADAGGDFGKDFLRKRRIAIFAMIH